MTTAIKRREIVAAQPASAVRWTAELASIELRFGAGCLADVGQAARDLGGSRCLVVTDPGVAAAGYGERAIRSLADAGLAAELFTGVGENPTTDQVVEGTEAARRFGADLLVGLGGGSPMDCAKGINFLLTNGGQMADYWGFGKAALPMLPTIGVPTTAGTGSEAQSYCLISDPLTHRKMACGDRKARFRIVLFDPELLTTTPRAVVATALMDAVSHAVETAVTRTRNPISVLLSREAWHRLTQRVPELLEGDEVAREEVLLGAHLAGAAIESSMLGAAHAAANPLTARWGVAHGQAVGLMLPSVVRHNGRAVAPLYAELLADGTPVGEAAESLAERLEILRSRLGLPARLREAGVDDLSAEDPRLDELSEAATREWTGGFNPIPLTAADFRKLYESVL